MFLKKLLLFSSSEVFKSKGIIVWIENYGKDYKHNKSKKSITFYYWLFEFE